MNLVNGIPVFDVGFIDFYYMSNVCKGQERLLARKIRNKELVEWVAAGKGRGIMIRYGGITIDMRPIVINEVKNEDRSK